MKDNEAQAVLLLTRSILRDDSYCDDLRFSDFELLQALRRACDELILNFRANIREYMIKPYLSKQGASFDLGFDIGYIFKLSLNFNPLSHGSLEVGLNSTKPFFVRMSKNHYSILNHTPSKDDILYLICSKLSDELELDSVLELDSSFNQAIALSIVCEMLLKEPSEPNLQRLSFYTQELEKEKARLRFKTNAVHKRVRHTKAYF